MPEVLSKYYRQLDEIERGLEDQAYFIIAKFQEQIVHFNTERQLKYGIDKQGEKIFPDYSWVDYAREKNIINPLPGFGTPDLNLTGSFYENFYLTAKNGEFDIFSSDEKANKLVKKYGDDIFGLTVEHNKIVNYEIILPELLKWVLSKLKI